MKVQRDKLPIDSCSMIYCQVTTKIPPLQKPSHVSELMGEKTHTWLDVKAATNKTKKGSREDPKHKGRSARPRSITVWPT